MHQACFAVTEGVVLRAVILGGLVLCSAPSLGAVNSWINAAGGNWNDANNWSLLSVPNDPGTTAEIDLAGAYGVTVNMSPSVGGLLLTNPAAELDILGGRTLAVVSNTEATVDLVNNAVIVINSSQSISNTVLQVGDPDTAGIVGPGSGQAGEIVLNVGPGNGDLNDAQLNIMGNGLHNAGHTIRGKGRVGGVFTNDGVILADRVGEELRISADMTQTAGGVVRATAGGVLGVGDDGVVSGGVLLTDTDGVIRFRNATLMGGAHNQGEAEVLNGMTLRIDAGGITNDGTVTVNSNQGISFTQAVVVADTSVLGSGRIDLNVADANGDFNDATLTTDALVTATNGPGHMITGKGRLSGNWINDGMIRADRDGQELRVSADVVQSATGSIRAINNGVLGLADGGRVSGGTIITSSGGTVQATNGTATIEGGIVNQGDMGVRNGRTLAVGPGGMVNNGTITVNSDVGITSTFLRVTSDVTVSGTGTIDLNVADANGDFNDAQLATDAGVTCTLGVNQHVTGKGRVSGDFVNRGTINADRAGQDLRLTGTIVQGSAGLIEGTGGGFAGLDGVAITGGFFDGTGGGAVLAVGGTNTISGVTSLGASGLRNGTSLSILAGGFTNDGVCTINTQPGINNTVITVAENATIDGTGRIDFNIADTNGDFNDALLVTADGVVATNAASHTVSGKGRIKGDWINDGTIAADRPGQDLQIIGVFDQTGGGVIRGDNGGSAVLVGAAVTGGFFESSAGGSVRVQSSGNSVSGVTNLGDLGLRDGARLDILAGGFVNDGVLTINTQPWISNTVVTVTGDVTIGGTGEIDFNIADTNGDFNDAQLGAAEGAVLTIGAGQTVTGRGRFFGDVVLEGGLAPGAEITPSVGSIRADGNGTSGSLTMAASAEYHVEASAEEVNDRIDATVPVVLGGTLRFTPIDGFDPPRPTRYTIVTGPDITGAFDTLIYEGTVPEGGVFRVVYTDTETIAAVTCKADIAPPIGLLDLADITFFTQLFLAGSPLVDLNGDGLLDLSDLTLFVTEFLAGCG